MASLAAAPQFTFCPHPAAGTACLKPWFRDSENGLNRTAGDGDALLNLFHDVLRDADLFDDLVYGIAVIKLDAEVTRDLPADPIAFRAVFASYCNNKICHVPFLPA